MNIRVVLVKIKGHSGITGNETADTEARQVACQMFKGNIVAPDERLLTVSDAYGISSEIARKSWQRLWDNESTGCYTYNCIPMVGTKVMFSKIRNTGIAYSQMLLHDTTLNKDSFRTGTSDTPLCDCGKVDESVEHFLLHCENYTEARKVTLDTVEDLFSTSKYRHSLRITEDLLLAPTYLCILWPASTCLLPVCLLYYLISILKQISVIIPAKARDYVFTGVDLSVCLFVCYHDN